MLEVAISPQIHGDHDNNVFESKEQNFEKQATSCNNSSIEDDTESYDESLVASSSRTPSIPIFESVSVVNSNDVHFGNKTIYQGPVTIKQFVYADGKSAINDSEIVNKNSIENSANVSSGDIVEGLCNPGFEKDDSVLENGESEVRTVKENVNSLQNNGHRSKVLQCFKTIKKVRLKETVIFACIVLLAFIITATIFLWRYQAPTAIALQTNSPDRKVDEEDNHTPVRYSSDSNYTLGPKVRIFTRLEWLAQPPFDKLDPLTLPVSLIIIQHTSTEGCDSQAKCIFQCRMIQTFHIESRGWFDIAYNFLLGGDGNAYEGRGWKMQGAHTYGYNNISIGFGFIGTFINQLPPKKQMYAFHKLVARGVQLGHITKNYKILAARQLYATESPGKKFYEEIKTWDHWSDKI